MLGQVSAGSPDFLRTRSSLSVFPRRQCFVELLAWGTSPTRTCWFEKKKNEFHTGYFDGMVRDEHVVTPGSAANVAVAGQMPLLLSPDGTPFHKFSNTSAERLVVGVRVSGNREVGCFLLRADSTEADRASEPQFGKKNHQGRNASA